MRRYSGYIRYIAAFAALLAFLAGIAAVSAIDVECTVRMDAVDASGNHFAVKGNTTRKCDDSCSFSMPKFDLSDANFANFTLYYEDNGLYEIYFYSTGNEFTQDPKDDIIVEIKNETEAPEQITCNEDECDNDCAVCSDNKCHEPGFECEEAVSIEKIFPSTTDIGVTQLNILIRNIGTVDLKDIYTELSGDGISTTDVTPIASLVSGDKDYVFLKMNATKAGNIDLVIKLYINGVLRDKTVGQITIIGKKPEETPAEETINVSQLSAKLSEAKARYNGLEQQYESKKSAGYSVDFIYDRIKETNDYINTAQNYMIDGDYKKAKANIGIVEENLNEISARLDSATQQKTAFSDTLRNNVLYIGSIAAAVVSVFSAYGLFKSHINKQKIIELRERIKLKKEMQEDREEERKEKEKKKGKAKKKAKKKSKKR